MSPSVALRQDVTSQCQASAAKRIVQSVAANKFGDQRAIPEIMGHPIRLEGLLVTDDAQVLGVMNEVLRGFAIETEICPQLGSAVDAVSHRRVDAIIVDWDGAEDPTRVVRSARKSSSNSNSTVVALVNDGSETHALLVGANFILHKPADLDRANRCMRAAYGTILQNRRRAARVPVQIPARAKIPDLGFIDAIIGDISIGGVALQSQQIMQIGWEVLMQFSLPESKHTLRTSGRVANANSTGRAGIQFSFIPDQDLEILQNWLAEELRKLEKVEIPTEHAESVKY